MFIGLLSRSERAARSALTRLKMMLRTLLPPTPPLTGASGLALHSVLKMGSSSLLNCTLRQYAVPSHTKAFIMIHTV